MKDLPHEQSLNLPCIANDQATETFGPKRNNLGVERGKRPC